PGFPLLLADLDGVRDAFDRFDLLDARVRFVQGPTGPSLAEAPIEKVSLLRIGDVSADDAAAAPDALYDQVTLAAYVVLDQHAAPRRQAVVAAFRARRGIAEPLERVDFAGAVWRKVLARTAAADGTDAADGVGAATEAVAPAPAGVPLVSARPGGRKDLTV